MAAVAVSLSQRRDLRRVRLLTPPFVDLLMSGDLETIDRAIDALRILTNGEDHNDDAYRHFAGLAWDLLKANWPAVEAIAAALIERRRIDGAEVEALMNGTCGPGSNVAPLGGGQ